MRQTSLRIGRRSMHLLEHTVLVVIALATTAAILQEIVAMVNLLEVHLADLLLLFIYLEVLAMVRAYWESGKLPVRMPLYIAIVALARYLILDMKAIDSIRILAAAGGALILALAVLAIRYGHVKYPYGRERSAGGDEIEIE